MGALMLSIDINHPDVTEFIRIKNDTSKVLGANISVRVNDTFMRAVEQDTDYILRWPCDFRSLDAFENAVFDFEQMPYNVLHKIDYEDMENLGTGHVYVKKIRARELFDQLCYNNWDYAEPGILFWDRILNYNMLQYDHNFKYAGVNPCLTGDSLIQTVEGEIPIKDLVGTTPYVYCMDNEGKLAIRKAIKVWKTRENANLVEVITGKGKLICTPDHRIYTTNRGWVEACNLQHGDRIKGLNRQTTGHKYCSVGLSGTQYEKEHRFIARHFYNIEDMDVHHINDNGFDNRLSNLEVITHEEHSRLSNTGRIIECNRNKETGRYLSKEEHKTRDCKNLGKQVGNNWFVYEVRELNYTEDVYDMTVEDTHNFIANGFVVHNCAEEPLPNGGACLLGSLNLAEFVGNEGQFMFGEFKKAIEIAVKALNVVQEEGLGLHPLQIQRDTARDWKQIGLGVMGIADMLIKMGITYGSKEAIDICDAIAFTLANTSIKTSAMLGEQLGDYPMFNKQAVNDSLFIKRHTDHGVQHLRNSQLLTIAPTGTLSTMLGISGGIEPIFAMKYNRTTKSLHGVDKTYEIVTPIAKKWLDEHPGKELPEFFIDSSKISPEDRVKMQAVWQEHIDASISSTVNLPKTATVDDVKNIYIDAWKNGLKGITVFRSGCKRTAILSKEPQQEQKIQLHSAPKRPKELEADYYEIKVKGENFIIIVGLLDDKPYEIFALPNLFEGVYGNHKGVVIKNKKRSYTFKSEKTVIQNIAYEGEDEKDFVTMTLMTSQLLRHGVDMKHILHTLKKTNAYFGSFVNAMVRVLSKYEESYVEECPQCHQNTLVHENGCVHCINPECNWSKCNLTYKLKQAI